MSLQSFLDDNQIHYRITRHNPAYTAQELAAVEHVSGKRVIKPVIIRADGQFYMCALPACYRVDLGELKQQLLADEVEVVDERHLRERFGDCDLDAAPPIGWFYGMTTLIDESLIHGDRVMFQAGTHVDAVEMSLADYRRVTQAEMAHFAVMNA
jgi:Ala-tRNA(Pro) deacylase